MFKPTQLLVTLMSILSGGSIGMESQPQTDQFLRLDAGHRLVRMGARGDALTSEKAVSAARCVPVPAGTAHHIRHVSATPMQIHAACAPTDHATDKVRTTAAAEAAQADGGAAPAAWSVQSIDAPYESDRRRMRRRTANAVV